jgi:hypothetical protein
MVDDMSQHMHMTSSCPLISYGTLLHKSGLAAIRQQKVRLETLGSVESDLLLAPELLSEWDGFIKTIKDSGLRLQKKPDTISWTGGDGSGHLKVKNVYLALTLGCWKPIKDSWRLRIWKDDYPLKLKLFAWILTENKLLMWDKLQARGWEGPSRCILCKTANESTLHVFFHCPFVRAIWTVLQSALKIIFPWSGSSIQDCMRIWFKENNTHKLTLIHLCWRVWKARNEELFQEKTPSSFSITKHFLAEATSHRPVIKASPTSRPSLIIPTDRTVAWFDGASQQGGALCGAGGKIVLNSHSSYKGRACRCLGFSSLGKQIHRRHDTSWRL